jgi:8-oxo-dGTP pyrophosphatase MutT (NUDIX family)
MLIDDSQRILMFRGFDPARPSHTYWFTVGGGLAEDETPAQGAVRELREETGLVVAETDLAGPVWHETTVFPYDGRWYRQEQDFYVVRVPSWRVDTAGFDTEERRSVDAHRWWSINEFASTRERYYPAELPELLREILGS